MYPMTEGLHVIQADNLLVQWSVLRFSHKMETKSLGGMLPASVPEVLTNAPLFLD